MTNAECLVTDMGLIHSGYSKQRNSKGRAGATEKGLRLQANHAAQGQLLKLMLIKIIYNTYNYFRGNRAGDWSKNKFIIT